MVCLEQDFLLPLDILDLVLLKNDIFVQTFHRVLLTIVFIFDQEYLPKSSLVNDFFYDEVLKFGIFGLI